MLDTSSKFQNNFQNHVDLKECVEIRTYENSERMISS